MPNKLEYITENDLRLLTTKAQLVDFSPEEVLIREGAFGKMVFMVQSGLLRVERKGVRLATLEGGDVCGEMAFLEGSTASASVIAEKPATAYAIDSAELHKIFEDFPHLGARFYRSVAVSLSRRLRETSRQLASASEPATRPVEK